MIHKSPRPGSIPFPNDLFFMAFLSRGDPNYWLDGIIPPSTWLFDPFGYCSTLFLTVTLGVDAHHGAEGKAVLDFQ